MSVERIAPVDLVRALAAARSGDHLYVDGGELHGQITLDKAITIEGRGHGTWLGNTSGPVIRVLARGVHLKDLDIDAGGPDEVAIWFGANPPRLDGVTIVRGKYASAGITFAPAPVIRLSDATDRRRMSSGAGPSLAASSQPLAAPASPPTSLTQAEAVTKTAPAPPQRRRAQMSFHWRIVATILAALGLGSVAIYKIWWERETPGSTAPLQPTCDDGDAAACRRDGRLDRACGLGDRHGCLESGDRVESSAPEQAITFYARACDLGLDTGCERAEVLHIKRDPCYVDIANQIYTLTAPPPHATPRPIDRAYWNGALAKGLEVARRLPDCAQVANALAHIYYRVNYNVCADGTAAEAQELIDKANTMQPDDPYILRNLGRVLAAQGRFEDALQAFVRSEELRRVLGLDSSGVTIEWVDSINALRNPRDEMVAAARSVIDGVRLSDVAVTALDSAERLVVAKAVGARFGLASELQAIDRFYFCERNPNGLRRALDEDASSKADLTDEDLYNLRLLGRRL